MAAEKHFLSYYKLPKDAFKALFSTCHWLFYSNYFSLNLRRGCALAAICKISFGFRHQHLECEQGLTYCIEANVPVTKEVIRSCAVYCVISVLCNVLCDRLENDLSYCARWIGRV